MSQFVKFFSQLSAKDANVAGGKGASLGEMTRLNFPVPPGFVVLARAFDRFLEESDMGIEIESKMHSADTQDIHLTERVSREIRALMREALFPKDIGEEIKEEFARLKAKYVAVRSSATAEDSSSASWAGELESYLNVTKKNLLEAVKNCWSSLFTPRAIFYRHEKGLHKTSVSVAVVIQKMIQSEVSGICFTAHPVTKDRDQMVIEAGYGLGEAIVGGKITPDTYIVHKHKGPFDVLDKNISSQEKMTVRGVRGIEEVKVPKQKQEKQKLTENNILELAKICQRIEGHYRYPQDIEWAYARDKFYIVQSRPITTLG